MGVMLGMYYTVLSSMCDNRKKAKARKSFKEKAEERKILHDK
jgi:hypothetical protein